MKQLGDEWRCLFPPQSNDEAAVLRETTSDVVPGNTAVSSALSDPKFLLSMMMPMVVPVRARKDNIPQS
jgi:hypothetical protein